MKLHVAASVRIPLIPLKSMVIIYKLAILALHVAVRQHGIFSPKNL